MWMAESGAKRRFFPDAFGLEAVAAVQSGRSVSQVAAELGLPDRRVRSWLDWGGETHAGGQRRDGTDAPKAQAVPARRVGPSPADQAAKIVRLGREIERLRMERDILKRAALIFGQATGRR
jgi:transposase